ncbi:MAG: fibrobacter succinogenes major paralogous domain-containing protein, partial [Prevotellaceae bacterium]|nr:fibrobacter succinogenes major paralogous domain-containing protein [Prevotellaceae bacterium]
NYKSSLQNDLSGLTRDTGLKLKLYAIYNDGNIDRAIELNTSLQDCACCGAYVASGVWKAFMCHNLGADQTAYPFTPSAEIHGAKYKWGVKTVALTQAEDQSNSSSVTNWTTITPPPTTSDNWDMTTANPCPDGWRVPTIEEWAAVINTSNNAITYVGTNWTSGSGNYTTGMKVGDALFLPAAGYRSTSNGTLNLRGEYGRYWSSTAYSISEGYNLNFYDGGQHAEAHVSRLYGYPVRCISE